MAPGAVGDIQRWEDSKGATPNFEERMMLHDALTFMPDQVLVKVDRASMAASLEARVPLLDHRLVEFAWRLPMALKYKEGQGKWCLRQVLYRYVPRELVDRPKAGFNAPVGAWLRGPLRDWAESLLSEHALREGGVIDPAAARRLWRIHLEEGVDAGHSLWSLLMLQAWLEETHVSDASVTSAMIAAV